MSAIAPDPVAVFRANARQIAFCAADHGTYRLYERLKRMYDAQFPAADWQERERAMRELARMAGV